MAELHAEQEQDDMAECIAWHHEQSLKEKQHGRYETNWTRTDAGSIPRAPDQQVAKAYQGTN